MQYALMQDAYLNWVDIVGNGNQLSLFLLNEGGHGVDAVSDGNLALGGCVTLKNNLY